MATSKKKPPAGIPVGGKEPAHGQAGEGEKSFQPACCIPAKTQPL